MIDTPTQPDDLCAYFDGEWRCDSVRDAINHNHASDCAPDHKPERACHSFVTAVPVSPPPDDLEAEVRGLLPCFTAHPMFPTDCGDPDKGGTHALGCPGFFRSQVLAALRKQRERADKAEADVRFMVERAADQKLDGYRELGQQAAQACTERDHWHRQAEEYARQLAEAKAEIARLRK